MCFSGNPMITASGTYVRDGIVAANFLSFGTEIKIPSLFGDKVFTVEDRMSSRYTNTVDVLVSSKREALNFGIKRAYIEILN
jgi:3D (Asp-Asp-Asp) domain-containing protein